MKLGEFLINNDAYKKFIANARNPKSINFKSKCMSEIMKHFTFAETPEGADFWCELGIKFLEENMK